MDDGLLEQIIQLEKELHDQVVHEEKRAAAWMEAELRALELAHVAAARMADTEEAAVMEQIATEVAAEAAELLQKAETQSKHLTFLDDVVLQEVLRGRLDMILPE